MHIFVWIFAFIVFNILVLSHEWGHYITARKFGVKVNEFAIGMGPKVFKFQKGDTLYSFRLFPIGGFCMMEGEEEESENISVSFKAKEPWKRAIILFAGAFMNLFLGVVFSVVVNSFSPALCKTVINGFSSDAISNSKLKVGDEIIAINGYKTHIDKDVVFAIAGSNEELFNFDVIRDGKFQRIQDVSFAVVGTGIGVDFYLERYEKDFINIMIYSFADVGSSVRSVWNGLLGLITGKVSFKNFMGPVGIAKTVGNVTDESLRDNSFNVGPALLRILSLMMAITVSLGVFNLFPFPALDGGRIVMLIPEMITGKPLNQKFEVIVNLIGFSAVILMIVASTYNDIVRIFKGN